jgi:hypothetical protein
VDCARILLDAGAAFTRPHGRALMLRAIECLDKADYPVERMVAFLVDRGGLDDMSDDDVKHAAVFIGQARKSNRMDPQTMQEARRGKIERNIDAVARIIADRFRVAA